MCYHVKNTLKDEKFKDIFTSEEHSKLEKLTDDTIKWVDQNQHADAETYKKKLKELEAVFHPIM